MAGERHFEFPLSTVPYRLLPPAVRASCGVLRGALGATCVRGEVMRAPREGVHAEREGQCLGREGVRAEREGERVEREGVRVRCAPTCTRRSGDHHGSRVISARPVVCRILPD